MHSFSDKSVFVLVRRTSHRILFSWNAGDCIREPDNEIIPTLKPAMHVPIARSLLIIIAISLAGSLTAQTIPWKNTYAFRSVITGTGGSDSSRIRSEDSLILRATATSDTVFRPAKSTTIALLASLILPGTGQIYNGSYWKAPIVWGVGYYFWNVYDQENKLFRQHRDLYAASIDSVNTSGKLTEKGLRDFYRGQRDLFGWYLAIAYLINLLDAYVDASLYNFEVSPALQPAADFRGIRLTIRF